MSDHSTSLLSLLRDGSIPELEAYLHALTPMETARVVSELSDEQRVHLMSVLDPDEAADILEDLPDELAADMLEDMRPGRAAAIVEELAADERADILHDVDDEAAEAILAAMDETEAAEARKLLAFPELSAGGIMTTDFLAFRETVSVGDVIYDLRAKSDDYVETNLQYVYVVDHGNRLVGVLRLRDLVLMPDHTPVREMMITDPVSKHVEDDLLHLLEFFDENEFIGLPVVDKQERLVGVVLRSDVEEAGAEKAGASLLKVSGIVGGEEIRTMPVFERARRRLAWLSVNMLLGIISISIIAYFEDTLQKVIALGIFFPMVANISGCSGSQAIAVSIRELSLGLARPVDVVRVLRKEAAVGVINGIVLGLLISVIATVWRGNPWLGLVVGTALAFNTLIAVSLGGTIPLLLKRFGKDPAMASGPILTTTTDLCGFLFVFVIATQLIDKLV